MKFIMTRFSCIFLALTLFSVLITSCSSEKDSNTEETSELITETKTKLVGKWKLVSSTIDGKDATSVEFECLKKSIANFKDDGTYNLNIKDSNSSFSNLCSNAIIQSGTYNVIDVNTVTLFNSTSEIKLIDEMLQITSTITNTSANEQVQVDTFIRKDNEEFTEGDTVDATDDVQVDEDEADDTNDISSSFDGSAVIAKLLGEWKTENTANECSQKKTLAFKSETALEFTQHEKSFNRTDLLKYNLNVSFPFPKIYRGVITKGNTKVVFDTQETCGFTKISQLEYVVQDDKIILIKNYPQVKILLEDNNTIKFVYEYTDKNDAKQTIEFVYKKY